MKREMLFVTIIVIIDQLVKIALFKLNASVVIVPYIIQLTLVKNYGVAWSMLNNKISFIIIISILAIGYLFYTLTKYKQYKYLNIGLCLMIGGAVGNLIDRVVRGYVVDYFDLIFIDFPIFNLADCFLVIGVMIMFITIFRMEKNGETI